MTNLINRILFTGYNHICYSVVLCILLISSKDIIGQNIPSFNFKTTDFTEEDGLPQNSVNDIDQTIDGYIWLATNGGLARFNGKSFKVYNKFNSPELASDRILSLFIDNEDRLWISTAEGLSYYYNGTFKRFSEKDGFEVVSSLGVNQDEYGTIWILTYPGFYKYKEGKFYKQEITEDKDLANRALEGEADFFVPFRNNIYAVIDNKPVLCKVVGEYPEIQILDIVENPKGSLWISTTSNRLFNIESGITKEYEIEKGLNVNYLEDLFVDSEDHLWLGSSYGPDVLIDNSFLKISLNNGVPNTQVRQIFQDREGNFWIGTKTKGLTKLSRSNISNISKSDGLLNTQILSLDLKNDGSLLIGTNGGGVYELQDNKIIYSSLNKNFTQKYIWSIFEDSQNRIWSNNKDLLYVKHDTQFLIEDGNKYDLYNICAFYESKDGAVWIGYQFGLLKFFNDKVTNYSEAEGLTETDVRCIMDDKTGNIWAGTINGLFKISQDSIVTYTSIPGLRNEYFRAIYQDTDGVMWFGTYGGGLVRMKDGKFFIFSTDNGMFDNVISHIVEDDNGYFWMGSNRGIQRASKNELNDFADGITNSFFIYTYDKSDGMISSETNSGFQPSAVKDKNGNIYFPTINGVTIVHTNSIVKNEVIPPVHIGEVYVNGKERNISDLHLHYDSSSVEIYFDILSYNLPNKNRAKYIMEGHDKVWNDVGERRYARYTNLPPGAYTFKVIGSNSDNIWNEEGASISITVLPPIWLTWWFQTFVVIILLSLGPIIYYRRITALKHKQQLQHEFSEKLIYNQEQERLRIAHELHDSLGQELLLIKNRAMLGIKKLDDETKVKIQLDYISDSAANAIAKVRSITHNLRPPELDKLGLTETIRTIISEVTSAGFIKIDSELNNIDGLIPKEKEINLVRIIQEALSNIFKHSGATEICMSVINKGSSIILTIEDNGRGFSTDNYTNGLGIMSMSERADILGGKIAINSSHENGTIIKVEIPGQK